MSDTDGDLFDGDETELDEVALARPRRAVIVLGVALAAFVFIGIAATALIAVLIFRVRDRADPNHTVRQKYQARYSTCVANGTGKDTCSAAVLKACEADSWWKNPSHAGQVDTVCAATVPGSSG